MALEKEVKVIISAVDDYSGGMLGFSGKAALVIAAVEAIAASMVAASVKAAEFAIDLGSKVWQSATDFHDAMYNVEAVAQSFGTTGTQISSILDDLTQKFPITGKQAGDSLQLIAQLGYGTEEQLRAMSDAANTLQIATGADLQTGIMGTLAILNSFNLDASEAARVVNLLAAAAFSSAANVEDLGIALRYAAPIASIMGISVEETVAAVATLRDRGLEASQAGTTLRMALVQLGKETKAKTEVLAKFGLTMADVNPEVVGLSGVVAAFKGQMISGSEAATLFGVRSTAFAHIVNMGAEAFNTYTKSITGTNAAYDAMRVKMETWTVVQKQVTGNLDLFQKTIAGGLIPELLHMIGTNENEGFRGVLVYITALEQQAGKLQSAFIGPIKTAIETVKNLFATDFDNSIMNLYDRIALIGFGLQKNIELLMEWGGFFADTALSMTDELSDIQNMLSIVNVSMGLLVTPFALVHDFFAFLVNAINGANVLWVNLWGNMSIAIQETVIDIAKFVGEILPWTSDAMKKLIDDAEKEIIRHKANIAATNKAWAEDEQMDYWLDNLVRTIDSAQVKINSLEAPKPIDILEQQKALNEKALAAIDAFEKKMEAANKAAEIRRLALQKEALAKIAEFERTMGISGKAIEDGVAKISAITAPGDLVWDNITGKAILFKGAVIESKDAVLDLDKSIEKMTDKEFSLYTEKFKADLALVAQESEQNFKIIQANLEWKAKIDIEDIKSQAEILKEAFKSVGESVKATSAESGKMLSKFVEVLTSDKWISASDKSFVQRMAEAQMELQRKALLNQTNLTNAEIANLNARTEKIKNLNKEAMITVDGDGLKPHLEAMMWEVFEAIQIRATEEGLDKLLLGGALSS